MHITDSVEKEEGIIGLIAVTIRKLMLKIRAYTNQCVEIRMAVSTLFLVTENLFSLPRAPRVSFAVAVMLGFRFLRFRV